MTSLDEYLAAHDAQATRTTPQQRTQRHAAARPTGRLHARSSSSLVSDDHENDAAAANGATRSYPGQQSTAAAAGRPASYQTAKARLLSQSGAAPSKRPSSTAAQKPLLVKSPAGGFARRPSSAAASVASASSALTPRSRRAAVNAGMSGRDYDALHAHASPPAHRISPAKTTLYPAAAGGHSRRTSSVSFAVGSTEAHAGLQQQQQSQQAAFASPSGPSGWFSPARSQRGHAIPAGSDHVPWRPSPDAAAGSGSLFNAAESSPLAAQDRARFQADVERGVFSPPRGGICDLNAPNFATRRFSSPAAIAGAPPTVFHSPLSASWIQALRARTARIMNLASTNAAASGNSPPFDPRAAAVAQAHSPFDPHAPTHSSSSLSRTRDRITKQNLILSPSILRQAPDGGRSMVSTPGTPSLDSRGNTPPPPMPTGPQRFGGMGAGVPAFMLRSPTLMARHRAAVAADAAAASTAAAAAGPVASASARQEAHQTLLAQNPQRQQLLEEFRQGLREMDMAATSALQAQTQPQPFTSQLLPVPIVAARPVQSMETLPAPQPVHRSPVQPQPTRGHSVSTSPMTFTSPSRASPLQPSQQQQQQHASPFVHRMVGSSPQRLPHHHHAHGDDDECDGCSHGHHHHALAPRAARRDVQTSPLAMLMPAPAAAATTRSVMTSPMPMQQPQQQQSAQFGSPLRSSPQRPAAAAVAPSIASFASSSAAASSVAPSIAAQQPLSLADRINANLAGLKQMNSRANHIAARSPVPAPAPVPAQLLPSDTTTIPAAHEAHRNVLQRIDRIVNLTKQPVVGVDGRPSLPQQQQQQPQAPQASFFPAAPSSERSFLSMPTPAALPSHHPDAESKYPDPSEQQPLLHDISELTNSMAMEDSRGDGFGGSHINSRTSFFPQQQTQMPPLAPVWAASMNNQLHSEDQERFRMWQQRLAQNQRQLQQQQQQLQQQQQFQQQPSYSAPPVSFAPWHPQAQQHLPALPPQPHPQPQPQPHAQPSGPVFHSDGISDALAQSLRNIQSLRSSLANSRGGSQPQQQQQQQHAQSQPAPMQMHYASETPQGYSQHPFAYSSAANGPFATAHLHPYAASAPSHDSSSSSDDSSRGVRLELHQAPAGAESTSIRVGVALMPEINPALHPQQPVIGWTMPNAADWVKRDSAAAASVESKQRWSDQPVRRASIATTICSGADEVSPARVASSSGSSRATTPPSPAAFSAASLSSPQPFAPSVATAAPARARLQPFTPIAASGIFAQAFRCMPLEQTPAAAARPSANRSVQPSPQQVEQLQNQQRHNASTLSLLNRQG